MSGGPRPGEPGRRFSPEYLVVPRKVRAGPTLASGAGCGSGTRSFLDSEAQDAPGSGRGVTFDDNEGMPYQSSPFIHFVKQVDGPKLI